jgi:hypothetical protein
LPTDAPIRIRVAVGELNAHLQADPAPWRAKKETPTNPEAS